MLPVGQFNFQLLIGLKCVQADQYNLCCVLSLHLYLVHQIDLLKKCINFTPLNLIYHIILYGKLYKIYIVYISYITIIQSKLDGICHSITLL